MLKRSLITITLYMPVFWSCIVDVEYNYWSQRMLLKRVYRLKTIHNMFGTLYTRVLNCKKKIASSIFCVIF